MNADKIVIIGANEFQKPLIQKAKEMGLETHVFAWEDGAVGKTYADYFYPISIAEKEEILRICKIIKPQAVATIATDFGAITVQYLAKRLRMPCNSDRCIEVTTNKYKMRKALREAGIEVPYFEKVKEGQMPVNMVFPCIVKPTDRSGSRGITKVNSFEELKAAIHIAQMESFDKTAIVEGFLEGKEYSCESISYNGKHYFLAITKKYTTDAPHFIEVGHLEPSGFDECYTRKIYEYVEKALDALDIKQGAAHTEFRVDALGNIHIIEIGARMGGDFIGSHLVYGTTGYDYVKGVIKVALGQEPAVDISKTDYNSAVRFVFSEEDNKQIESLLINNPEIEVIEKDITCEDWQTVVTDSSARKGHYILRMKEHMREKWELNLKKG